MEASGFSGALAKVVHKPSTVEVAGPFLSSSAEHIRGWAKEIAATHKGISDFLAKREI